ncbi:1,4-alpha-glucan branching protein GlgB [Paenibacillus cisolokensis]|uniref:1,4-alpha-glucan branching protein GlgB n=1 Tax=Paenibacillus cisolokensis TaxID=1658519 RepID=UPI003D2DD418
MTVRTVQTANYYGIRPDDLYLFNEGTLYHSYRTFGAHRLQWDGTEGVRFAVWAPNASDVRVAGSFNHWDGSGHRMERLGESGVWALFIPGLAEGAMYKYEICDADGRKRLKADPYAFFAERRPGTASIVADLSGYRWRDGAWQRRKRERLPYDNPLLIYEAHLGSWRLAGKEQFRTYGELSAELADYAADMGYTHIELLPLAEHPFDRSWGYQITGYFAATSRYGTPKELMAFVDRCHRRGLGVILDWVPGHFCKDDHGLRLFDGTPIYEGPDPRLAEKPEWGTLAFDFGRTEVMSFLISNAIFWMDLYHIDGLRVDAVASMIDLNFGKPPELAAHNAHGGTENPEALRFLRKLNEIVFHYHPHALMIAEDSSAWPAVTSPTYWGGLGFNFKWNMGWMNDMLRYMTLDPDERKHHHHLITFSLLYAFSENFVLPLSHDEVVHGKRSLLHKMPGSYEEKFAQLRLFFGYWMTHPGKKLLFMGSEFGQFDEWKDTEALDWFLLDYELHAKMKLYSRKLNRLYKERPALWEKDTDPGGFEWIDAHNAGQSVISFVRRGNRHGDCVVAVCNFSRQAYRDYRIGVPAPGRYRQLVNSDDRSFGGASALRRKPYVSEPVPMHGRNDSIRIGLPPLSFLLLAPASAKQTDRRW